MGRLLDGWCSGLAGFGWTGGLLGWLIALAFVAAVVLAAIWLVRRSARHGRVGVAHGSTAAVGSARDLLQLRYARGEIGREQYLRMRDDLA